MLDINKRQILIIDTMLSSKTNAFTRKDFSFLQVSDKTITRDLTELVQLDILNKHDKTYTLNRKSYDLCEYQLMNDGARMIHKKSYQFDYLRNYEPNVTSWLEDHQLAALAHVNAMNLPVLTQELATDAYRKILNTFFIDLTYASSRFENVNISMIETRTLLEWGERPEGLTDHDIQLVLNHKRAIDYIFQNIDDITLHKSDICNIHALLMQSLLHDTTNIGRIRHNRVTIDGSAYEPLALSSQIDEELTCVLEKASRIENKHEQAFFLMVMLSYLQSFADGNKRVSRLVMNIPYLKNNLIPFSFNEIKKSQYHLGLLMFYEYGRFDVLSDVFTRGYVSGAKKYQYLLNHVYQGGIIATLG